MNGYYQTLYTKYGKQVVFIPFVCKRCGKCCREVSFLCAFDVKKAAKLLGISLDELKARFVEHVEKHRLNKPCFFFIDEKNECSIYPVRPSVCMSYPTLTDSGNKGIGCPGYSEIIKLYRRLAQGYGLMITPFGKISICPEVWEKILKKLDKIYVSDEIKRKFITINEKEVKGRKQK